MDNFAYFRILFLCFLGPTIMFYIHRRVAPKYGYRWINLSVLASAIPFIIWDYIALYRSHWSFNDKYISGIKFFRLPIEEFFFFIIIPQSCLLIWVVMKNTNETKNCWSAIKRHFSRFKIL
ncbi:MAG: lycopene cyclase domain-containing protein [Patescibacteria group bacterium]